jgi:hypothetical protein
MIFSSLLEVTAMIFDWVNALKAFYLPCHISFSLNKC